VAKTRSNFFLFSFFLKNMILKYSVSSSLLPYQRRGKVLAGQKYECFGKLGALEKQHEQSVRSQIMKIVMNTMEPCIRASLMHGGKGFF
jgi:hypothetical protein